MGLLKNRRSAEGVRVRCNERLSSLFTCTHGAAVSGGGGPHDVTALSWRVGGIVYQTGGRSRLDWTELTTAVGAKLCVLQWRM